MILFLERPVGVSGAPQARQRIAQPCKAGNRYWLPRLPATGHGSAGVAAGQGGNESLGRAHLVAAQRRQRLAVVAPKRM